MSNNNLFYFFLLCFLLITFNLHAQSSNRTNDTANEAWQRLEQLIENNYSNTRTNQRTEAVNETTGGRRPNWVTRPSSAYPNNRYITAVGEASTRAEAENLAFTRLVSFFGLDIEAVSFSGTNFLEIINDENSSFTGDMRLREEVHTATTFKSIVGAEIGEIWDDGNGRVYALAFIIKERTISIYTELIRINQIIINNLITMNNEERNTFNGFARYKHAAQFAVINAQYAKIINILGGLTVSLNMTTADFLNSETVKIIENISIALITEGDRNNRVRDAFALIFTNERLRTQGSNSPYVLEIEITMEDLSNRASGDIVYCRWTVNANLRDRTTGQVLLPYSITDRSGHRTFAGAQDISYREIIRKIETDYKERFKEYLESLMF